MLQKNDENYTFKNIVSLPVWVWGLKFNPNDNFSRFDSISQVKDQFWETGIRKKKEVALEVAMYPQQSKIPHLGHFHAIRKKGR